MGEDTESGCVDEGYFLKIFFTMLNQFDSLIHELHQTSPSLDSGVLTFITLVRKGRNIEVQQLIGHFGLLVYETHGAKGIERAFSGTTMNVNTPFPESVHKFMDMVVGSGLHTEGKEAVINASPRVQQEINAVLENFYSYLLGKK